MTPKGRQLHVYCVVPETWAEHIRRRIMTQLTGWPPSRRAFDSISISVPFVAFMELGGTLCARTWVQEHDLQNIRSMNVEIAVQRPSDAVGWIEVIIPLKYCSAS